MPLGIKVFKHGIKLAVQATGQGAFELTKNRENDFENKEFGIKMTFGKDGKMMVMTQNGKDFHYKKK